MPTIKIHTKQDTIQTHFSIDWEALCQRVHIEYYQLYFETKYINNEETRKQTHTYMETEDKICRLSLQESWKHEHKGI